MFESSQIGSDQAAAGFLFRDLVTGGRYGFALADRAAAGGGKTLTFFKNKAALQTGRRVHAQFSRVNRPGDMLQMIEDFLFTNAQDLRNLTEIQRFLFQKIGDFLADRRHIFTGAQMGRKTGFQPLPGFSVPIFVL